MRKIYMLIFIVPVAGFFLLACKPTADIEKDKEAIKAVIEAETHAFYDKNSAAFKDLYVQDESQTRVMLAGSELSITSGWSKFKLMADSIPLNDWSELKNFTFRHEYVAIKVLGNVAWAILKYQSNYYYKGVATRDRDLQTIVLEKTDGKWKISCFVISTIPSATPLQITTPADNEKDRNVRK
jgi:SnoaL-like domain